MADRSSADPKLPQDAVIEILKRLPVASLLRFRCVSRSWRSAIDDPRFVALHSNHSALHGSNRYVVRLDWDDPVQHMCSLFPNESLFLPPTSQIEIPFATPPKSYGLVGSCNGLICVTNLSDYGYGPTMYLWNVFTGNHKAVRRLCYTIQSSTIQVSTTSCPVHPVFHMETVHIVLGFGFDARSNDYKIVRVLYFPDYCYLQYVGRTKPRVEIYSLSTDSWRSLECEVPALSSSVPAVFLNGNLHWLSFKFDSRKDDGGYRSIVLFDVAGEVFDEMALSEDISEEILNEDDDHLLVHLAVLNDLLAVFISLAEVWPTEFHSFCSVWVMREYGVSESWTKLYNFEASGWVIGFDGFMKNGELLMKIIAGGRVSWNPITGQYTNLPLSAKGELVNIAESLVLL